MSNDAAYEAQLRLYEQQFAAKLTREKEKQKRKEEEQRRKIEEERLEQEARVAKEEARRRQEEQDQLLRAEEELRKEEERKARELQELQRKEEERRRKAEEEARKEEARRARELEEQQRKEEERRRKAEEEARKAEEERRRREDDERRKEEMRRLKEDKKRTEEQRHAAKKLEREQRIENERRAQWSADFEAKKKQETAVRQKFDDEHHARNKHEQQRRQLFEDDPLISYDEQRVLSLLAQKLAHIMDSEEIARLHATLISYASEAALAAPPAATIPRTTTVSASAPSQNGSRILQTSTGTMSASAPPHLTPSASMPNVSYRPNLVGSALSASTPPGSAPQPVRVPPPPALIIKDLPPPLTSPRDASLTTAVPFGMPPHNLPPPLRDQPPVPSFSAIPVQPPRDHPLSSSATPVLPPRDHPLSSSATPVLPPRDRPAPHIAASASVLPRDILPPAPLAPGGPVLPPRNPLALPPRTNPVPSLGGDSSNRAATLPPQETNHFHPQPSPTSYSVDGISRRPGVSATPGYATVRYTPADRAYPPSAGSSTGASSPQSGSSDKGVARVFLQPEKKLAKMALGPMKALPFTKQTTIADLRSDLLSKLQKVVGENEKHRDAISKRASSYCFVMDAAGPGERVLSESAFVWQLTEERSMREITLLFRPSDAKSLKRPNNNS